MTLLDGALRVDAAPGHISNRRLYMRCVSGRLGILRWTYLTPLKTQEPHAVLSSTISSACNWRYYFASTALTRHHHIQLLRCPHL